MNWLHVIIITSRRYIQFKELLHVHSWFMYVPRTETLGVVYTSTTKAFYVLRPSVLPRNNSTYDL